MFWLRQYELMAINLDISVNELIQKSDIFIYISKGFAKHINRYLGK